MEPLDQTLKKINQKYGTQIEEIGCHKFLLFLVLISSREVQPLVLEEFYTVYKTEMQKLKYNFGTVDQDHDSYIA
jgi:hypothetical protein